MKIRSGKDLCSGLLFFVVGSAFAIGSGNYAIGAAARIGPGYFPRLLGIVLALAGLVCVARALWANYQEEQSMGAIVWRPLLAALAALAAFALLVPFIGFLPSVALLLAIGSLAAEGIRPVQIAVAAAVLAFAGWLVFEKALGLPFPAASLFG